MQLLENSDYAGRAITNESTGIVNMSGGKLISIHPNSWTFTNLRYI